MEGDPPEGGASSADGGGGVQGLRKGGWESALAYFDGMSLEEMKKVFGDDCSRWGLQDFEDLRAGARKQRRAIDPEENKVIKEPAMGHKDNQWIPQTAGRPEAERNGNRRGFCCLGWPGLRGINER